ncbi:hypothetical protein CDAR_35871, partial [Caerostris darwini]
IIWGIGCVPSLCRKKIIIPFHKKDKNPEEIDNYRTVTLESLMSKPMERMVYNRLNWCLESHSLHAEEQLYPEAEWLTMYTYGSRVEQRINAGAEVFCDLFSVYDFVGRFAFTYDSKVEALRIAITQL